MSDAGVSNKRRPALGTRAVNGFSWNEGDDRDLFAAVLDTIMGVVIRIAASNSKCTRDIIAKVHDKMMGQYIKNRAPPTWLLEQFGTQLDAAFRDAQNFDATDCEY
jgi:hypothetical protein